MQKPKNKSSFENMDFKKELLVKFGRRMKEIRIEKTNQEGKKFSQEKLANLSGLHRNYISDTERGERNVSVYSANLIITALGYTFETFFSEGFEEINKKTEFGSWAK